MISDRRVKGKRNLYPCRLSMSMQPRSHFAAVGQSLEDVREFGVYDRNLRECPTWLKSHGIETVAMESTGSYWQNLYDVLIESGFEVLLIPGRQTKNMAGKTDVKDCRWIQFLHSVGLVSSSFLPDIDTEELRTLYRHRDFLGHGSNLLNGEFNILKF